MSIHDRTARRFVRRAMEAGTPVFGCRSGPPAACRAGARSARRPVRGEPCRRSRRTSVLLPLSATGARTFVLDTSVLLADPGALKRFAEHEVVLPVVVITELEGSGTTPRLGFFAPAGAAHARRAAHRSHGRLDVPGRRSATRATAAGRAQPHRHRVAARRASGWATTTSRILAGGASTSPPTAPRRHAWSPRTCRCGSRRPPSGCTPRSTAPRRSAVGHGLDRDGRARGLARADLDELVRRRRDSTSQDARTCPATPGLVLLLRTAGRPSAGSVPTSRCSWCAATARRSGCTAAPPSSGSRWTCCSTPRSASCRSAAGPAPASPRWRCAPAWRR